MPYPGWKTSNINQYKAIKKGGVSKSEAAAIVNARRTKMGDTKKAKAAKKKRG
jgi:hypothetical protein